MLETAWAKAPPQTITPQAMNNEGKQRFSGIEANKSTQKQKKRGIAPPL
jgi:hypothetical protein